MGLAARRSLGDFLNRDFLDLTAFTLAVDDDFFDFGGRGGRCGDISGRSAGPTTRVSAAAATPPKSSIFMSYPIRRASPAHEAASGSRHLLTLRLRICAGDVNLSRQTLGGGLQRDIALEARDRYLPAPITHS